MFSLKYFWLYVVNALIFQVITSTNIDIDSYIITLKEEAKITYELLLKSKKDNSINSNSLMKYEEFEIAYVTMALEEETERILKSKGLTLADLEQNKQIDDISVEMKNKEINNDNVYLSSSSFHHNNKKKTQTIITKKDAPISESGKLEHMKIQELQSQLIKERGVVDDDDDDDDENNKRIFEIFDIEKNSNMKSQDIICAPPIYTKNWYSPIPNCSPGGIRNKNITLFNRNTSSLSSSSVSDSSNKNIISCKRVVSNDFITKSECLSIVSSLSDEEGGGMSNLFHQSDSTSLVPSKNIIKRIGGLKKLNFILELINKTRLKIEIDYNLAKGSLYNSGSLLNRLKSKKKMTKMDGSSGTYIKEDKLLNNDFNDEDFLKNIELEQEEDIYEMNSSYVYWNAHIDKANVASYDYSALLYLNNFNDDFIGGEFEFIDSKNKYQIIQPKCGKLLTFTSGFENLHRVRKVTKGTRYVLAMWFTCSPQHSYSTYSKEK